MYSPTMAARAPPSMLKCPDYRIREWDIGTQNHRHRDTQTQGHRDTGTQGHTDTGTQTQGHRDTGTRILRIECEGLGVKRDIPCNAF